jgi:hypothetical protein
MRIIEFFKATIRTMKKNQKMPHVDLFLYALIEKCNFVVLPNAIDLQYLVQSLKEMVYTLKMILLSYFFKYFSFLVSGQHVSDDRE